MANAENLDKDALEMAKRLDAEQEDREKKKGRFIEQ